MLVDTGLTFREITMNEPLPAIDGTLPWLRLPWLCRSSHTGLTGLGSARPALGFGARRRRIDDRVAGAAVAGVGAG